MLNMVWREVLGIIAILVIIEGLFIAISPRGTKRITAKIIRSVAKLRVVGIIEIIIGILLLIGSIIFA